MGNRKRDRDKSGLHRTEKSDDVFEALRCQYQRPVARGPDARNFLADILHAPIELRPGQRLFDAVPILVVVDIGDRRGVGLQTGALAKHGGNRRGDHGIAHYLPADPHVVCMAEVEVRRSNATRKPSAR